MKCWQNYENILQCSRTQKALTVNSEIENTLESAHIEIKCLRKLYYSVCNTIELKGKLIFTSKIATFLVVLIIEQLALPYFDHLGAGHSALQLLVLD